MPLDPSLIWSLLQVKRSEFKGLEYQVSEKLRPYRQALLHRSREIAQRLNTLELRDENDSMYAEPLEESDRGWIVKSNLVWHNREQSLQWVRDRLTGIPTFAVDGSQIYPTKDFSLPIALIQIGWFENFHRGDGDYEKDIAVDLITPNQFAALGKGESLDRLVNRRRLELEVRRIIDYMQTHSHQSSRLVFYDGSLIASFAETFDRPTYQSYLKTLRQLLSASQQHQIPLVAYIDTSAAEDTTQMLQRVLGLPPISGVGDPQLLNPLMEWGDRTLLCRCHRPGILSDYQEQANQITFTYLKTHAGYPVRLELPLWIVEAGLLDQVINWVRAETIIGRGYPYAIETADQVTVLRTEDRKLFYRLLQDWAEQEEIPFRLSRKMVSKAHRR
ncbi:DNA double-strand break repair nuclease NurA [Roseofilum capinflatum]|uniref:DNA double-strand break repair nuclease NurA n=1 Tax=Roseofilum capinflatum BLCC-M114 TaxID=3022440 RepID=A0ABT7B2T2_9CYAN|nr:DNA double-strand break repair nuclease NurA [Roseofilum capinflatum]MDJ1172866.1 DNA double-strand break repair nuclease NurA [Roseofilum capinflatum BLCC-M114]